MLTIRSCRTSDVPDVLAFLDAHWKPRHIFTTDRRLFDWQYARRDRPGEYAILIARRDDNSEIAGMLGYLPTRHFDAALAPANTIWLALWKVRDDIPTGPLGLELLTHLMQHEPHTSIGVIGFQPPVAAIYKALKFDVGELQHYVLPNPDVSRFELASFERPPVRAVPPTEVTAAAVDDQTLSSAVRGLDLSERNRRTPQKSVEYFRARFIRHPIYRYRTFVLRRHDRPIALVAMRVAAHAGRSALRIVDVIGPDDAVPGLAALALDEVRRSRAEYADIHNSGIDRSVFVDAGFSPVDPGGPDVVPNHFEPFERRNAPIRFALKSSEPAVLFKGDGDQDRPNVPQS
jgi:hypothetical protein